MTYHITSQCIGCRRCEFICPTGAITKNEQQYQINPERCNDCLGHYTVPQCWAICPTNGGVTLNLEVFPSSTSTEPSSDYWDIWFNTYDRLVSRLKTNQSSTYWQRWFDAYSQTLARQLQTPTSAGVHS